MASCIEARLCLLAAGTTGGSPSVLMRGADGKQPLIPLPSEAGVTLPELASAKQN